MASREGLALFEQAVTMRPWPPVTILNRHYNYDASLWGCAVKKRISQGLSYFRSGTCLRDVISGQSLLVKPWYGRRHAVMVSGTLACLPAVLSHSGFFGSVRCHNGSLWLADHESRSNSRTKNNVAILALKGRVRTRQGEHIIEWRPSSMHVRYLQIRSPSPGSGSECPAHANLEIWSSGACGAGQAKFLDGVNVENAVYAGFDLRPDDPSCNS
ncbi:uncharacterized protein B0I36DRAFT_72167 [Microdochium trichocladiopsis]|uniref:Uncharacterized protein n=1 Tax=Microdochium trichocladiopsis TaxID=1682393 RepID=A0A9P8YEI6_9PEZI|nr:uncharacterized protein B0I36DRAFT_72167 [Microdochium trichocladiopsis]KAH7037863.1 hypothetical protein B0I36DRAFT_72167 [Microdochium trichocladiopsis]